MNEPTRKEQTRAARKSLQQIRQRRRDFLQDPEYDAQAWQQTLTRELDEFLVELDLDDSQRQEVQSELQESPDPVRELEGLVASLQAFQRLGRLEAVRKQLLGEPATG